MELFFDYVVNVVIHHESAATQLNKLRDYIVKYGLNKYNECVVANLHENEWGKGVLGRAWVNTYPYGRESALITCDDNAPTMAHECGHNLGAVHVNNSRDIMYPYTNGSWTHYDRSNINRIKHRDRKSTRLNSSH